MNEDSLYESEALKKFGKQVKKYLDAFGLLEVDLAYLTKSNSKDIDDIVAGLKSVGMKKVIRIAFVFGKTYYELGNPNHPLPKKGELPIRTLNQIDKRAEIGTSERDYDAKYSKKLDEIIYNTEILHKPSTAKDILGAFSEVDKKLFDTQRINNYLAIKPRSNDVIQTGEKKDGLTLYILKSHATEEMKKKHEELESKKRQRNSKNVNKQ